MLNQSPFLFKLKGLVRDVNKSVFDKNISLDTEEFSNVHDEKHEYDSLSKTIRNSKTIELPNCGHLIPLEEPEEFSEHIINFANNLN